VFQWRAELTFADFLLRVDFGRAILLGLIVRSGASRQLPRVLANVS